VADKSELFDFLVGKTREVLESDADIDEKLKSICRLLKDHVSYYNWVGFYFVDKKRKNELVLGPFEGEPTEHTRIPFGRGICGQAAALKETFLVQDVSKQTNYLSCSVNVKSEIVVPIFQKEEVFGEIDIDSHVLSPFTKEDETFLKKIAQMASRIL
jgi:GAF domain-containing protein